MLNKMLCMSMNEWKSVYEWVPYLLNHCRYFAMVFNFIFIWLYFYSYDRAMPKLILLLMESLHSECTRCQGNFQILFYSHLWWVCWGLWLIMVWMKGKLKYLIIGFFKKKSLIHRDAYKKLELFKRFTLR